MLKFIKYPSIFNTNSKKEMQQIIDLQLNNGIFLVQEKIHGANFSFWTDGEILKPAKRTAFLKPDEKFFNFQKVLKTYNKAAFSLFENIQKDLKNVDFIIIYGELFGGIYLHPQVKPVNDAFTVQNGIFYSPDNEFCGFDISINGEYFLSVKQTNYYLEKHNFLYAKTLFRGTYDEALIYPNDFNSTIPALLNLPEPENNMCEGVIIRPENPVFINKKTRLIIKNKNQKWAEEFNISKKETINHFNKALTQNLQKEIIKYLTANRLNNVVSKIGTECEALQLKISFMDDAFDDFMKNYSDEYNSLSNNKKRAIRKVMNVKAAQIIKTYLKK